MVIGALVALAGLWYAFGRSEGEPSPVVDSGPAAVDGGGADHLVGGEPAPDPDANAGVERSDVGGAAASAVETDAEPEASEQVLTIRVVRGATTEPVPGLRLRIRDAANALRSEPIKRTTDAAGEVQIVDPPRAFLAVHSVLLGSFPGIDNRAGTKTLVRLRVQPGLEVRGRVVTAEGSAVPDAEVLAHGADLEPAVVARTDERGEFVLRDVEQHVALVARGPDHAMSLAEPLRGTPGVPVEVLLRLGGAPRRIIGRVLHPAGGTTAGAMVVALPAEGPPPEFQKTHVRPVFVRADDGGRFELFAPVAATESVRIVAALDDVTTAPGMALVAAGRGDASADVELQRAARVTGKVTGPVEHPHTLIASAWTQAPDLDLSYLLNMLGLCTSRVGADGSFALEGIVPGTCAIRLRGAGVSEAVTLPLAAGADVRHDFALGAGEDLEITARPARPTHAAFQPYWSALLLRVNPHGNAEFVSFQPVGTDGRVKFASVTAADYEVVLLANAHGDGFRRMPVGKFGPFRPGPEPIQVEIPERQLPTAGLRGRLVDAQGAPVAGTVLRLIGQTQTFGPCEAEVTSSEDGTFVADALVPASWRIHLGTRDGTILSSAKGLLPAETRDLGDVRMP